MSPAPTYTVPTANTDTATEEPKIITALAEIKDLLDGGLDEANIDTATMDFPLGALANVSAAQILMGNAGGVVTATDLSGDATISSAGALSLAADSVGSAEIAAGAVGTSEIATDGVGTAEIAANAVTADEIAADAVGSSEIATGAVNVAEMGTIPAVSATKATGQNAPNEDATIITFGGTDEYDTDTMHNPSSNSSRITFTTAGVYAVSLTVGLEADATGIRLLYYIKNGNTLDKLNGIELLSGSSVFPWMGNVCGQHKFAANDYIEAVIYHEAGNALTIRETDAGASGYQTRFSAAWVSKG